MKRDLENFVAEATPPQGVSDDRSGNPPEHAPDTDLHRLIREMAGGSRDAFRQLYEKTHSQLLSSAMRLVRNRAVAEDVVQETYIRVWRYSRSYKPGNGLPLTWITQILRNRAIDLRAFGRHEEVSLAEEDTEADASELESDDDPVMERASVGTAGTSPRLAASIAWLSGPYRQVLHLAHHEGMSHAEIAQHLGVPLGTAKTWLRRAVIALRVALECEVPADGPRRTPSMAPTEMSK